MHPRPLGDGGAGGVQWYLIEGEDFCFACQLSSAPPVQNKNRAQGPDASPLDLRWGGGGRGGVYNPPPPPPWPPPGFSDEQKSLLEIETENEVSTFLTPIS